MSLELKPNVGATHRKKRLGCGTGSGRGGTSCRGKMGQKSRSGKKRPYMAFEGGQMPLYRKMPKFGFFHMKAEKLILNLNDLQRWAEKYSMNEFSSESLFKTLGKSFLKPLVILGKGQLTQALTVKAYRVSAQAKAAIEAAGGKVVLEKLTSEDGSL